MTKVRKAVIAAAGYGTRFLPQTKAMPKEMLPLIDKPIIQYIVEELVDAGIKDIVIVTGYHKRTLEDHFDEINADLKQNLLQGGKGDILAGVEEISNMANFAYVRQKGQYGNATPLLNAEHLLGGEPFIYSFADDFVRATPSRFKQMIAVHEQHGGSVLTVLKRTEAEDYKRYGYVGGPEVAQGLIDVQTIIEKPGTAEQSPSDNASVSGYIFEPTLFKYLHEAQEQLDGTTEFAMQPSIQRMIEDGHKVYGCEIQNGKYYDTGNKLEYLKTLIDFGLEHPEVKDAFADYIREVAARQ